MQNDYSSQFQINHYHFLFTSYFKQIFSIPPIMANFRRLIPLLIREGFTLSGVLLFNIYISDLFYLPELKSICKRVDDTEFHACALFKSSLCSASWKSHESNKTWLYASQGLVWKLNEEKCFPLMVGQNTTITWFFMQCNPPASTSITKELHGSLLPIIIITFFICHMQDFMLP